VDRFTETNVEVLDAMIQTQEEGKSYLYNCEGVNLEDLSVRKNQHTDFKTVVSKKISSFKIIKISNIVESYFQM